LIGITAAIGAALMVLGAGSSLPLRAESAVTGAVPAPLAFGEGGAAGGVATQEAVAPAPTVTSSRPALRLGVFTAEARARRGLDEAWAQYGSVLTGLVPAVVSYRFASGREGFAAIAVGGAGEDLTPPCRLLAQLGLGCFPLNVAAGVLGAAVAPAGVPGAAAAPAGVPGAAAAPAGVPGAAAAPAGVPGAAAAPAGVPGAAVAPAGVPGAAAAPAGVPGESTPPPRPRLQALVATPVIQLGYYRTEAAARRGWSMLGPRYGGQLGGLAVDVVKGPVIDGLPGVILIVYGDTRAALLARCAGIRADGGACGVTTVRIPAMAARPAPESAGTGAGDRAAAPDTAAVLPTGAGATPIPVGKPDQAPMASPGTEPSDTELKVIPGAPPTVVPAPVLIPDPETDCCGASAAGPGVPPAATDPSAPVAVEPQSERQPEPSAAPQPEPAGASPSGGAALPGDPASVPVPSSAPLPVPVAPPSAPAAPLPAPAAPLPAPAAPLPAPAASLPAPAVTPPQASGGRRAAPASASVAAAVARTGPLSVVVYGDSFAEGLWGGFYRLLEREGRFHVVNRARHSTGLSRPHSFDWMQAVAASAAEDKIDIAIVSLGLNDFQSLQAGTVGDPAGRGAIAYDSERWARAYAERVGVLLAPLTARGVTVFWIGLPAMRAEDMEQHGRRVSEVCRQAVERAGAVFVPVWPLTVDERGAYTAHLPDGNGRPRQLRAGDGVHFTLPGGYDWLAHRLWPIIEKGAGATTSAMTPAADAGRG